MNEPTAKHAAPTQVAGVDLRCQICQHDSFFERKGQLNTRGLTFFRLDWINPAARCVICANCGYIHWFMSE
jgi:hypothetical protein